LHGANARIDEEAGMPDEQPHPEPVVQYRDATALDAEPIATLHADSWRRHYRGAYLDSYLDGDVVADRHEVWTSRLAPPRVSQFTVVADGGDEVVGFAHTVLDNDPRWGSLLENVHVRSDRKRSRIGTRLLSEVGKRLLELRPSGSLYLWVLDQNIAGQSFYDARGGTRVETALRGPFPGGGRALGHRYHWPDPARLLVSGR
jgi:ribosomal protein S18 acetylase RimI-like enzyme